MLQNARDWLSSTLRHGLGVHILIKSSHYVEVIATLLFLRFSFGGPVVFGLLSPLLLFPEDPISTAPKSTDCDELFNWLCNWPFEATFAGSLSLFLPVVER